MNNNNNNTPPALRAALENFAEIRHRVELSDARRREKKFLKSLEN